MILALLLALPAHAGSLLSDASDEVGLPAGLAPVGAVDPGPLPAPMGAAEAARLLRVPEDLVTSAQAGVGFLYARRYPDAARVFDDLTLRYPTTGVGPLGMAILFQERMFENFDWTYDAAYRAASARTRAQLEQGLDETGAEPLEHFVLAALGGLDAVHSLRKGDYLPALGHAIVGMRALQQVEAEAPAFPDPRIGDGMYLYWRSVVTASSSVLPDFPDRRAEGLRALMQVESGGVLLGPGATLVMAYAYISERDWPRALRAVDANDARYPDCVVNELTRGRVLVGLGRTDAALAQYDRVIAQNVGNQRVHYLRGRLLAALGRPGEAAAAFTTYLGFSAPPAEARAQAWYALGQARAQLGDAGAARAAYTEGARLGDALSRRALEAP